LLRGVERRNLKSFEKTTECLHHEPYSRHRKSRTSFVGRRHDGGHGSRDFRLIADEDTLQFISADSFRGIRDDPRKETE
jgi:hypothetical protein